jgi:beta-lactamase class D
MCVIAGNRLPSSGEVYIFQRVLGQRKGEGWKCRGRGGKESNLIAKFGWFVSIIGASEDPEKNIS